MSDAKVILDTCIVSYLMRGGPIAEAYRPHIQGKLLGISFITIGELYFGAEKANRGENKRKQLETTL
jgi:predicted nucleic acid-binding protein